MSPRWHGAAVLIICAALAGGCSGDDGATAEKAPANPAEKAEQDKKNAESGGQAATKKDQFMPVLQAEYARVKWPKAYPMSTDKLWQKLGGDQNVTALSESDANSMVSIWNLCAWSLQLVDDTKADRPTKDAVAGLTALNSGDMSPAVKPILDDARLGGLSTANQFIEANDCKNGFA